MEKYYDIIYSISAHESPECLHNLIENILLHNFNYKICIILHLNNYMIDNFFCNLKNVYINNIYYNKKLYNHTILKSHIDNFNYLKINNIKSLYFIPLSSNCMFIKQMNIPSSYKFNNKIYQEEFKIKDDEKGWHWEKILKNKEIIQILKKNKVPIRIGYHEGRIIFTELFDKIQSFIIENKIFEKITNECVFEEFLLQSLECYFNDSHKSLIYLKLFKNRINKNDIITEKNLNKIIQQNNKIYIIKRIPRIITDPIRKLVNIKTNINHKKNGHFKNGNDIFFFNYYNFYIENHKENTFEIKVKNINYNSFQVENYNETFSDFEYDTDNDEWIEKRYLNFLSEKYSIIKWTRTKPKKIAVIIRGSSSLINNWGPTNIEKCLESFSKNILSCYKKLGYDYDIFFHTYQSDKRNILLNKLKPKKFIFDNFNKISGQVYSLKKALELVDDFSNYDSYFITRFDLVYKKSLQNFQIYFNNNYYLFKKPNNTFSDIIYILNKDSISQFYNLIKNEKNINLHQLKFPFKINSICKNRYNSDTDYCKYFHFNNNPLYILERNRRWGFTDEKTAIEECKKQKVFNKKIAILLYGISYDNNHAYFTNKIKIINYKNSLENYKKYLFNHFKNNNFEIDIFICSNSNEKEKDIVKVYNPKKYLFIDDNKNEYNEYYKNNKKKIDKLSKLRKNLHPERYYYTNIKKLKVLNLCKEYANEHKIKYDNILLTRFDLSFEIDFNEVNINYCNFNVISTLENPEFIDDNFYIFPFHFTDNIVNILNNNLCEWGHSYKKYFAKHYDINYIYNQNKNIKYLDFYKIKSNFNK